MKKEFFLFGPLLCLLTLCFSPLHAQESLLETIKRLETEQFIKKGNLDTAICSLKKLCTYNKISGQVNNFCSNKLGIAQAYSKAGRFDKSKNELLDVILYIENNFIKKDVNTALYFYEAGSIFLDIGELDSAEKYLNRAHTTCLLSDSLKDNILPKIFYKYGSYFYFKNKIDSSLYYYQLAYDLTINKRNSIKLTSNCIHSIGILLSLKGDYSNAEKHLLNSQKLSSSTYSDDHEKLALINNNLGRFYVNIGLFKKSLEYLNKSEKLLNSLIDPNLNILYRIYWNKGLSYHYIGETSKGILYLEKALEISKKFYNNNNVFIYPLIMDLAYCHEKAGNTSIAEEKYKTCLNSEDIYLKVKVLKNLASICYNNYDTSQAKQLLLSALKLSEINMENDSIVLAHSFLRLGEFLCNVKNPKGLYYLDKSFEIYIKRKDWKRKDLSIINVIKGDYYLGKDNYTKALMYYQKALLYYDINDLMSTNGDSLEMNKGPYDPYLIKVLLKKTITLWRLIENTKEVEFIEKNINCYKQISLHIFKLLTFYTDRETRLQLTRKYENIYEEAIRACRLAFSATGDSSYLCQAFDFSERNKAMNLLLALKDEKAKDLGNIPDSLRRKERDIQLSKYIFNNSLYEERKKDNPNLHKIQYWNEKLLQLEWEYNELLSNLEENYPDYYSLKYDYSTASVKEIQHFLNEGDMLLEYTMGKDSIYIFSITPSSFHISAKPADTNLVKNIFSLRRNLKLFDIHNYDKNHFLSYQKIASKLYSLLIRPFDAIKGIENILIIPDDELGYLSFDMLLSQNKRLMSMDFRRLPFLIKRYNISYAPSASLLTYNHKKQKQEFKNGLLALAPVYSEKDIPQEIENNRRNLPGAILEVNEIPRRYYGKRLTAKQATERNFKNNAANYDILHLAMHTRINDEYPLSSVLKFSPEKNSKEDGLLHIYEIFGMKLNSRMVVLSACNSGNGKLEKGEGINSLARAFLYAGTESIIMTLWEVEDGASRKLITYFYDFLSKGHTKDKALRLAKLKYLHTIEHLKEGHPYFWSGYVVYGNKEPIQYPFLTLARIKSHSLLAIIILLFVISSWIWWRRYRRVKRNASSWRNPYILRNLKKR